MSSVLFVTPIYAVLSVIFLLYLSYKIIRLRWKNRVPLLDGGVEELTKAIRSHGNFVEYVPLTLILMGMAELNGLPHWALHGIGAILLVGRALHAYALPTSAFKFRVRGMILTFSAMILASGALIVTLFI